MNAQLLLKMKEPDSFKRSLQNPAHTLTLRKKRTGEKREEAWGPPENVAGPYNPLSVMSEVLQSAHDFSCCCPYVQSPNKNFSFLTHMESAPHKHLRSPSTSHKSLLSSHVCNKIGQC